MNHLRSADGLRDVGGWWWTELGNADDIKRRLLLLTKITADVEFCPSGHTGCQASCSDMGVIRICKGDLVFSHTVYHCFVCAGYRNVHGVYGDVWFVQIQSADMFPTQCSKPPDNELVCANLTLPPARLFPYWNVMWRFRFYSYSANRSIVLNAISPHFVFSFVKVWRLNSVFHSSNNASVCHAQHIEIINFRS